MRVGRFLLKALIISLPILYSTSIFSAPEALKVVGRNLQTVSNCPFRIVGVNICGLEWQANGMGPPSGAGGDIRLSITNAVNVWKANVVRIPLNQDFWFGYTNANMYDSSTTQNLTYRDQYRAIVDGAIATASSLNCYVELDLHWSGNGSWGSTTVVRQQNMPDDHSTDFWQDVATRYANNPAVIFNPYNEPINDTWTIWRNGGTSTSGFHTPGHQSLVNTIRATGANNLIIVGGQAWAWDMRQISTYFLNDTASGNGIAYEAHIYDNKGGTTITDKINLWNTYVTVAVTAGYCVVIGEFGPVTDGTQDDAGCTPFESELISWINGNNPQSYTYNAMGWCWHQGATPKLIKDWAFTPTDCHGLQVRNWLQAVPTPNCGAASTATFTRTRTRTPTPVITFTRTATRTSTRTATRTATRTNTSVISPTFTATRSATASVSPTSTYTRTRTYTRTATRTNTILISPTFTATRTYTQTATRTNTPVISPTFTATRSATASVSPTSTYTRTRTYTRTATATNTTLISPTFTATRSASATASMSQTPTNTRTWTASVSPTFTYTRTRTYTRTATATNTTVISPTFTVTRTYTRTGTPTGTAIVSPTFTGTNTASPQGTLTDSPTRTHSPTRTPSRTASASATASVSPMNTNTRTPTASMSHTPSNTKTWTQTMTQTRTATTTATQTATRTNTVIVSPTFTGTNTASPQGTLTNSPTRTNSPTLTVTFTGTRTRTVTPQITPTNTSTRTVTTVATPTPSTSHTPPATSTYTATQTETQPSGSLTFTPTATVTTTPDPCICPSYFGKNINSVYPAGIYNYVESNKYVLVEDALVRALHVYVTSTTGAGRVRMAIYSDNGAVPNSVPQNMLVESSDVTVVQGWNVLDIADTSLTAGTYWIAVQAENGVSLEYDEGTMGNEAWASLAYGAFPAVYPVGSWWNYEFSMYADYCPVVCGTPTYTRTMSPTATETHTASPVVSPTITATLVLSCECPDELGMQYVAANYTGAANFLVANWYPMFEDGTAMSMEIYSTTGGGNAILAIYGNSTVDFNPAAPAALVCQSAPFALSAGWNTVTVPQANLQANTIYWLAYITDTAAYIAAEAGSTGDMYYRTFTYGTLPASFGASTANTINFSIHVNYCPAVCPPTPTPTGTETPVVTATDTPAGTLTNTPVVSATETPADTASPSATNTPDPTSTDTPQATSTDTPLPTETDTPVPSATFTLTATPTATRTSSATASVSPSFTYTETRTQTATPTLTRTMIPFTPTYTVTPTSTPVIEDTMEIIDALPYPNPYDEDTGDLTISFDITRLANLITVSIYSCGYRKVVEKQIPGLFLRETIVTVERDRFERLAAGVYYIVIKGENGAEKAKSKPGKLVIIR